MNDDSADPQQPEVPVQLTEQQLRARRARSIAIALALGAFVVLVFVVTLVRLGARVATPPI
ncbi:MAG: CoxF protein [Hyphomicrobiales bacterium]|nr:CoxF protein [Hyphomicrobiales bacterium]